MATPSLQNSIAKLAMAGERAGFTVEQMISMLNAGVTLEGLLRIIEWRLESAEIGPRSSHGILWFLRVVAVQFASASSSSDRWFNS